MLFAITLVVGVFILASMIWTMLYMPLALVPRPPWPVQLADLIGVAIALVMFVRTAFSHAHI